MSCWRVREVCEQGKEGRLFTLSKERPLTIGKSDDCSLQLKLRTIENRHAVVEWNKKKFSYIIRDLGSSNGTFINNAPLTKGTEELKHGDSLRFGYEKSHVFRVEECFQSPVKTATTVLPTPAPSMHNSASAPQLMPTSTSTQTSPQTTSQSPSMKATDTQVPAPMSPAATQFVPAAQLLQQGVIFSTGGQVGYLVSGGQPGTILTPGGQQCTVLTPGGQQATIQYILPQTQGFGQPPSTVLPHVQPLPQGSVPATPPPTLVYHTPSPTPPLVQQQAAPPTNHTTLQVQDIETECVSSDVPSSPKRTDGRRQVEFSNSPNLSTTSKLYGQPSWWGEEKGKKRPLSDSEFKHIQPGTQILRDFEYDPRRDSDEASVVSSTSSRSSRLSVKDELRLKAISNSLAQEQQPSSTASWVVDFGTGTGTASKPPRFQSKQRPRSADPSPVRAASRRRDPSPSTTDSRRLSSAPSARSTVSSRRSTFVKREPPATSKQPTSKAVPKKPTVTRSATTRRSVPSSPQRVRRSSLDSKRKSDSASDLSSKGPVKNPVKSPANSPARSSAKSKRVVDKTYTKIEGQGSSDKLQTSLSDLSLTSLADPVIVKDKAGRKSASDSRVGSEGGEGCEGGEVCEGEEEKPGSSRKQWTSDQSQTSDNLMFASIEARMRRLSKTAQGAAIQLSSIKRGLQDMGVVRKEEHAHIQPFSPAAEHIPQWKFFNKEVDSIFRSIRSVERWLNDIDTTVSSMQLLPQGGVAGEEVGVAGGEEGVDYETTESELEYYQDSIEDNFASCSDNYGSD